MSATGLKLPPNIRRLKSGDESILEYLAVHDSEFDIPGRGGARPPLSKDAATSYLADQSVLFWVALLDEEILGFLSCLLLPMRAAAEHEVLVYEIGVHHSARLQGIGRAMIKTLDDWMRDERVSEAWVLADNPGALAFYEASGFKVDPSRPTYLTRGM